MRLLENIDMEAVFRALRRSKEGYPGEVRFTRDAIEESRFAEMPHHDKERLWGIHARLRQVPEECLPVLLAMQRRYPDVPMIYNFLGVAYFCTRQEGKYQEILRETIAEAVTQAQPLKSLIPERLRS